jgi:hypothetical protein
LTEDGERKEGKTIAGINRQTTRQEGI